MRKPSSHWLILALSLALFVAMLARAESPHGKEASNPEGTGEQMDLESARYLFDIEGDAASANKILDRLQLSPRVEIRTQADYLRGRFQEEEGKPQEALRAYMRALGGQGLTGLEKRRLYARVLSLNPDAIQPLRKAGRSTGLPTRVFSSPSPGGTRYVLVEESENPDSQSVRLSWQDTAGMLHPMPATLSPGEEVLDATPEVLLTYAREKQEARLRIAPQFAPRILSEKFPVENGMWFPEKGGVNEALFIGSHGLRWVRDGEKTFSFPLPDPGCVYLPASPRSRQGVLFCPGHGLYRADLSRHAITPLALPGDPPAEVALSGDFLAIRYGDHVEIRRGPAYDALLWGFPAESQDQLAVGRDHAFLVNSQGILKAYSLRTGQLDWEHGDDIAEAFPADGDVFAVTHARGCLALDEKGRVLFNYEAGWGSEPLLLPTQDWLVVHPAKGWRVRINRELLRLTGGDRGYLFHDAQDRITRHDLSGALRALDTLLELEPGNGIAWKEKAQLLRAAGVTRKELSESWLQAARSQSVVPWTNDPVLRNLAHTLGAKWIWKRHLGPRFFPSLVAGRNLSFYVENDNQTLVLLDNAQGELKSSFHFPEPLDMKVASWLGDTILVSSPTRLYLLTPLQTPGIPTPIPLRNPICQGLVVPEGLLYSDWSGSVQFLELPGRKTRWEKHLSHNGLLLAHARGSDILDVFEIEGGYHSLQISTGQDRGHVSLPPGTITECHAGRELAFAGYNEGLLLAVNREHTGIAWQKDMGEQIFSLSGRGDQVLLVGTASKRILNVQGLTGNVISQTQLSTYLFNRPLLVDDGYWVGTTEPALEKRSLAHVLLQRFPLTDMPGTPTLVIGGIAVSTLDNFILNFSL